MFTNQLIKVVCIISIFSGKEGELNLHRDLYRDRFKEGEFRVTPVGYWSKRKALEALRWTIEEKKNWMKNSY